MATTRVRFAPSPTGLLHLGGLRTALFNYLFAARNKGKLILRVEDTDQSRVVPGSLEYIQRAFKWLGVHFDEGPSVGGPHAPYHQSERLSLYQQHAQDLLKRDGAYHCFCSKERLHSLRSSKGGSGKGYDRVCRDLSSREVDEKLRMGVPYVLRLKVPLSGTTVVNDVVYGDVEVSNEEVDDQVLLKTDGFPTYHLANVIDDHLMEISHVLRGEEWLTSTCKHKILYNAFNWKAPVFAHIPLLTTKSGSKLSKRHQEIHHVLSYKERGYTPEGLLNFIAMLGWNPKTEKEVFTLDELIQWFSLDGLNKSTAIVEETKLDWFNSVHARRLLKDENRMQCFVDDLRAELLSRKAFGLSQSDPLLESSYLSNIIRFIQERTFFIPQIPDLAPYFWIEPKLNVNKIKSFPNGDKVIKKLLETIEGSDFTKQSLGNALEAFSPINVKSLIRQCVTGGQAGPDIVDTVLMIGKERTINRLKRAYKLFIDE